MENYTGIFPLLLHKLFLLLSYQTKKDQISTRHVLFNDLKYLKFSLSQPTLFKWEKTFAQEKTYF